MSDRYDRLPKWAHEEILDLQRRALAAENDATLARREASEANPDTRTFLDAGFGREDIPLPERQNVIFKLPNGKVTVREESGSVYVNTVSDGRTITVVMPHASNALTIALVEIR